MGPVLELLIALVIAGPVAQAPADGPYLVELEISYETGEPYFFDPAISAVPVEVPLDIPVSFRLSVFDVTGEPVDVEDTTELLEIRREGGGSPVRFADMERVAPGVYETTHTFRQTGRWVAVVQPDVGDRSELPEGSSDEVTMRVEGAASTAGTSPSTYAIVASVALVLLVAWLVIYAGRRRRGRPRQRSKEPVTHDTWWNSP